MSESTPLQLETAPRLRSRAILVDILLILILVVGAFFRLRGIDWGEYAYMHPDERFLIWVGSDIEPVKSLSEYFDTANSSLNPHNRGHGFYVYGTLPMFITRYAVQWVYGHSGFVEMTDVGRPLSAIADLLLVFLVFVTGKRLYDWRVGLLGAAFSAAAVLQIQQSHFFTMDTFITLFTFLAFYFATRISMGKGFACEPVEEWASADYADYADKELRAEDEGQIALEGIESGVQRTPVEDEAGANSIQRIAYGGSRVFLRHPFFLLSIAFGLALGMAVASKLNAAPVAALLPLALAVQVMRLPAGQRSKWWPYAFGYMALAAIVSLLVFRIFQPYAFSGPGFFGLKPNPLWVANIRELLNQGSGDVDFPPALQWARRSVFFSGKNLALYGLGLPAAVLAAAGFLGALWRVLRGEWQRHYLILAWTGLYFAWQSTAFNPTMRYQLPVYPTLAILAGWALVELYDRGLPWLKRAWTRGLAIALGVIGLGLTLAWAFAFSGIYTAPFTRTEASRWIYQNVPGPVNLHVDTDAGELVQPLPFPMGVEVSADRSLKLTFTAQKGGLLTGVRFPYVVDVSGNSDVATLVVKVAAQSSPDTALGYGMAADAFRSEGDSRGKAANVSFDPVVMLEAGQTYALSIDVGDPQNRLRLSDVPALKVIVDGQETEQALPEMAGALREGESYGTRFRLEGSGKLRSITLAHVLDWEGAPEEKTLRLDVLAPDGGTVLASETVSGPFLTDEDIRGDAYQVDLAQPLELAEGEEYLLRVTFEEGPGALAIYGSKPALESSWDDGLPLGLGKYSPYDYRDGIYRSDLNFEMYWDDNAEKLARFKTNLNQADYVFISSNRQWGTTTRVPERYPLTSAYYRALLGCPAEREITWCYAVATPGMFQGSLGFELVHTVQSEPTFGPFQVNTQFGEEAFSVYDHPKVLIFKKSADYDADAVARQLDAVDLSQVVHLTPKQASNYPGNLMLSEAQKVIQRAGGTWSALFNRDALQNQYPWLDVVLWYVVISLLGWAMLPILRIAMRGLPDHGFPLARMTGMLLLAYVVWLLGSAGIPFSKLTISLVALGLLLVNLGLGWLQRKELAADLRENWRHYLAVEAIALVFFLAFLAVRLGNPDLWHPWKGGEKPMDFSYFNAVLKSTTFPPYDPWFAGGYLNYYYYGFVLVGVPVKWLGIVPSIAYNIVLPQLYSLMALGAFSVVWNLLMASHRHKHGKEAPYRPYAGALMGAVLQGVAGNLGTVRMLWHGMMRLAAPGGAFQDGNILQKIGWTVNGFVQMLSGPGISYAPGDWYWIPSRVYPLSPITEFPAFTFLYADLHAHLIALPVALLAISWAVAVFLRQGKWGDEQGRRGWLDFVICVFLGGLIIGTFRPTNTWDFPTYLGLGVAAVMASSLMHPAPGWLKINAPEWAKRAGVGLAISLLVAVIAMLVYQPFTRWYGQGYGSVSLWKGERSPGWSYLTHWGVFLFLITSWLAWETRDWMAKTPLSSVKKLKPYRDVIYGGLAALAFLVVGLLVYKVWIAWMAVPLAAWAAVLILRPGMPPARRAVLFMIGTGLTLTLVVEVVVLQGDLERMNTVFKIYLQVWTLFSVCAAAALGWVFPAAERLWPRWQRNAWGIAACLLIGGALLFPLLGGSDKIRDRIDPRAPHTLDGMDYMLTSTYNENGVDLQLSQDYEAIRWMQDNIAGSPVIVEGNVPEYRWGNRYTIYTGLPGVVGWNWHQRQQRALTPDTWVTDRVAAISEFYNTTDEEAAREFLDRYEVSYIVVGQMEKAIYALDGLEKFEARAGDLWDVVYQKDDTTIYQVRR